MACFIVPAAEAVVTSVATRIIKSNESQDNTRIQFSTKLGWLNKLLWGGSSLLAFEHLWHGEITPTFPFLTAISDGNVSEVINEMSSTGVAMSALITLIWVGMLAVSSVFESKDKLLLSRKEVKK